MNHIIDHIVVGANSLEEGIAYVKEKLGITIPPGGKHPHMGTHNHLVRVGQGIFLEVIAIDPQAEAPKHPRWFALDDPEQKKRLAQQPRLIHWLVGSKDIQASIALNPLDMSEAKRMTRGQLHWLIGIREDGALLENGIIPTFIQWPDGIHPAENMSDLGLKLETLRLIYPQSKYPKEEDFKNYLEKIKVAHLVEIQAGDEASLEADFRNTQGELMRLH